MKRGTMGWQWHQPNHMQIICTSLQTDNHASISSLSFLQAGCSSCRPTNSVRPLKVGPQEEHPAKHQSAENRLPSGELEGVAVHRLTLKVFLSRCTWNLLAKKTSTA